MRKTEQAEWNGTFTRNPFRGRMFHTSKMDEVEQWAREGTKKRRRISIARLIPLVGISVAILAVLVLFLPKYDFPGQVILDSRTAQEPSYVETSPGTQLIEYKDDAMVRSHAEYMSDSHGPIAVDTDYYKNHPPGRGEVVYFKSPDPKFRISAPVPNPNDIIARIVALPGEKIAIRKGQVYIDGKKLDTFYGKAIFGGLDEKSYFEQLNAPGTGDCNEECKMNMRSYFHTELSEQTVPAGRIFVLADTWIRSVDSLSFGPLPLENTIGKVLGYGQQKASPFFRSGTYDLQGIPGKIGVLGGFKAGKPNKYMWHFWGTQDDLFRDTTIRVIGLHYESGYKSTALRRDGSQLKDQYLAVPADDFTGGLGGSINGADANMVCMMELPKPGLWRLDVYIGERLFASINVDVQP